eukprot:m.35840 g.35840  ORF g.35840 m.35840 type:complete len:79 (+) comp17212_c0_seq1:169-405(+)
MVHIVHNCSSDVSLLCSRGYLNTIVYASTFSSDSSIAGSTPRFSGLLYHMRNFGIGIGVLGIVMNLCGNINARSPSLL